MIMYKLTQQTWTVVPLLHEPRSKVHHLLYNVMLQDSLNLALCVISQFTEPARFFHHIASGDFKIERTLMDAHAFCAVYMYVTMNAWQVLFFSLCVQ